MKDKFKLVPFLAGISFSFILFVSNFQVSAQGFPPPGPFYLNAINCGDYSSYPNCDDWVIQCFETGINPCVVSEQIPCAEVCGDEEK